MTTHTNAVFTDLLQKAVTEPGTISQAYRQFHTYSLGNQLLAWGQCLARGLTPGPMATYPKWKALGRCVRKGERALSLCMPITVKRHRSTPIATADTPTDESDVMTWFVYKRRWFVLTQTDGDPIPAPEIPTWDGDQALEALGVREIPFDQLDGNCLGVARDRSIAINPVNPLPHKTRFHELAHVLLGHTSEGLQADHARTPRTLRECEAESVALLCCAALALPGVDECRGYIQSWWGHGHEIPERSAQRILKVADQILKAGAAVAS